MYYGQALATIMASGPASSSFFLIECRERLKVKKIWHVDFYFKMKSTIRELIVPYYISIANRDISNKDKFREGLIGQKHTVGGASDGSKGVISLLHFFPSKGLQGFFGGVH